MKDKNHNQQSIATLKELRDNTQDELYNNIRIKDDLISQDRDRIPEENANKNFIKQLPDNFGGESVHMGCYNFIPTGANVLDDNINTFEKCEYAAKHMEKPYFGITQNIQTEKDQCVVFDSLSETNQDGNVVEVWSSAPIDINVMFEKYVNFDHGNDGSIRTNGYNYDTINIAILDSGELIVRRPLKIEEYGPLNRRRLPKILKSNSRIWRWLFRNLMPGTKYWRTRVNGSGATINKEWAMNRKFGRNYLLTGDTLAPGEYIASDNGKFRLIAPGDKTLRIEKIATACALRTDKDVFLGGIGSITVYTLDNVVYKQFKDAKNNAKELQDGTRYGISRMDCIKECDILGEQCDSIAYDDTDPKNPLCKLYGSTLVSEKKTEGFTSATNVTTNPNFTPIALTPITKEGLEVYQKRPFPKTKEHVGEVGYVNRQNEIYIYNDGDMSFLDTYKPYKYEDVTFKDNYLFDETTDGPVKKEGTIEECQNVCNSYSTCGGFAYNKDSQECVLGNEKLNTLSNPYVQTNTQTFLRDRQVFNHQSLNKSLEYAPDDISNDEWKKLSRENGDGNMRKMNRNLRGNHGCASENDFDCIDAIQDNRIVGNNTKTKQNREVIRGVNEKIVNLRVDDMKKNSKLFKSFSARADVDRNILEPFSVKEIDNKYEKMNKIEITREQMNKNVNFEIERENVRFIGWGIMAVLAVIVGNDLVR